MGTVSSVYNTSNVNTGNFAAIESCSVVNAGIYLFALLWCRCGASNQL